MEHIVPAVTLGKQLQYWKGEGRKDCTKNGIKFNLIEADLHKLLPVISEIIHDRNSFQYAWHLV